MEAINDEYTQEIYAWYHYEDASDDCYINSSHFLCDNFHVLFDDSTPSYVEHIMEIFFFNKNINMIYI